jgi:DivIVA domain-containing protein
MAKQQIHLTPKDILEREFKIDTRGYRLKEVDRFLDLIISDYQTFIGEITRLQKENSELVSQTEQLKKELEMASIQASSQPTGGVNYVDLLQRVSNLEKEVFGNK